MKCGCNNGIFGMSPTMLLVIAAVAAYGLGCGLDCEEKEVTGHLLLAIGELLVLMAIQQSRMTSKMQCAF